MTAKKKIDYKPHRWTAYGDCLDCGATYRVGMSAVCTGTGS